MEESISKAAGSQHGDNLSVEDIERFIREIGRTPYERTTTYGRRERARPARREPIELPLATARPRVAALQSGY
jgi:FO synthase